jgi:hypothetical protein
VSKASWEAVKSAKEEMIRLINLSFNKVGDKGTAMQLSAQIFEEMVRLGEIPAQRAIDVLKSEARTLIG